MARVNFCQLFFTNSIKVKDNKKHHKVHLIIYSNLFSNFPGLLGDWSSSAFKTYLEFAFKKKAAVAKDIAKSFDLCAKNL